MAAELFIAKGALTELLLFIEEEEEEEESSEEGFGSATSSGIKQSSEMIKRNSFLISNIRSEGKYVPLHVFFTEDRTFIQME